MNLLTQYQTLITSSEQLKLCAQATSVEHFLQQLKYLWHKQALTDDQLLSELSACSQHLLDVDVTALGGQWPPYRYHAKTRSIHWCLPQGHATEPFHDQYIERCRRLLLNQLITPRTSLDSLLRKPIIFKPLTPAGFIFHLSRCGSTLVSGCLAELDNACVLSESPLLTEIMLDNSLNENEKKKLLPQLIYLQGSFIPGRDKIIVKWNAWDIFFLPMIRSIYPQVPVLFLVRNPVEILASHQRLAGRHMAGDLALTAVHSTFGQCLDDVTVLDLRIRVMKSLLDSMMGHSLDQKITVVDYTQLSAEKIGQISKHFKTPLRPHESKRILERMKFHSKELQQSFHPDILQKQQLFLTEDIAHIHNSLTPLYQLLLSTTQATNNSHARVNQVNSL